MNDLDAEMNVLDGGWSRCAPPQGWAKNLERETMVATPTIAHDGEASEESLQIVVVEGESVTVHDLPAMGSVLVGRGDEVDVQLADPSASARHARLQVGDTGRVTIEDLGSRNGVQVRGQRIATGEATALAPAEAAVLGSALLLLHRNSRRVR